MVRTFLLRALVVVLCCVVGQTPGAAQDLPVANTKVKLLPWPKSVSMGHGEVSISSESRILVGSPELEPLAGILREELRRVIGLELDLKSDARFPQNGDIVLRINPKIEAVDDILMVRKGELVRTREGAYRLESRDLVSIEGFDYRSVAEGTATLLQAVRRSETGITIPTMTVHDWPHADYTGAMVDVARQLNSIEDLQHMIQVCRAYKVRYLQLHLTDDQAWTFPSNAYSKLGTRNGSAHGGQIPQRYDLSELKAIVKYADQRGVTLIPELETPGHSSQACETLPDVFGYIPTGTNTPVAQGAMNIANPRLYQALDTILGEMCDTFESSPYVHIGFDEVSGLGQVASTPEAMEFMQKKGLKDAGELLSYFTLRVNEMVRKRGKTTIIWEGAANGISKDIIHMTWDGNARTAERLIAQGIPTITVPWNLSGVPWQDWTMYHCNGSILKEGDPVLGAMLPMWEQAGPVNFRWLRGGIAKRQERTWGPVTAIDPAKFASRSESADQVLDRVLYGFSIQQQNAEESLLARDVRVPTELRFLTWPGLGEVRITKDGSEPTRESPVYTEPFFITDNQTISARLFDQAGKGSGPTWVQPYTFSPLSFAPEGLLPQGNWFADSVTLAMASTMPTGTIRYTLDGSEPQATSPAFTEPLVLAKSAQVKARWFDAEGVGRGNVAAATYRKLPTATHAALNKPVSITVTAKLEDPKAAARRLVDGSLARGEDWGSPEVLPLGDSDLEAIIDMGENTKVLKVIGRFFYHQEAGIYPAVRVDVLVSDDGNTFMPAGTARFSVPQNRGVSGISIKEITVEPGVSGRYVKVFCKNHGLLPEWHKAPGVNGHMMLDEILVNPKQANE